MNTAPKTHGFSEMQQTKRYSQPYVNRNKQLQVALCQLNLRKFASFLHSVEHYGFFFFFSAIGYTVKGGENARRIERKREERAEDS